METSVPEYAGGELDSGISEAFASEIKSQDLTTPTITTNLTTGGDDNKEEVQQSSGQKPKEAEDVSEHGTSDSENLHASSGSGDFDADTDLSFAAVASALEEVTLSDSEDITLFDGNSASGYHGDVDQMSLPKKTTSKLKQPGNICINCLMTRSRQN